MTEKTANRNLHMTTVIMTEFQIEFFLSLNFYFFLIYTCKYLMSNFMFFVN